MRPVAEKNEPKIMSPHESYIVRWVRLIASHDELKDNRKTKYVFVVVASTLLCLTEQLGSKDLV